MPVRDIPPAEWRDYFDGFSRRHAGWRVAIEIADSSGTRIEAHGRPLRGITIDPPRDDGGQRVAVLVGGPHGDRVAHLVASPDRITIEETAEGADVAVTIHACNGPSTVVRFCTPMPTEMVDGVAEQEAVPRR